VLTQEKISAVLASSSDVLSRLAQSCGAGAAAEVAP
jgi:hypothetical protein